jgi:hypothetical protein
MPFHGSASADAELHNPRGFGAVPLDLTDNDTTAYRIRRDDGSTYPSLFYISTQTSNVTITLGNSTDYPAIVATTDAFIIDTPQSTSAVFLVRRGTGDPIFQIDTAATSSPHNVRLREAYLSAEEIASEPTAVANQVHVYAYDNAGTTELRARTTDGTVNLLDVGGAVTGTTNLSWTINEDAAAASNEDPHLVLLGGDGVAAPNNDLVRFVITQDSSAETVTLELERSRNAGAYADVQPLYVLTPGATSNQPATLSFGGQSVVIAEARQDDGSSILINGGTLSVNGGSSGSAMVGIGWNLEVYAQSVGIGNGVLSRDNYQVIIGHSAQSDYSVSEYGVAIGYQAYARGDSVTALGRGATAGGASAVAIGHSSGGNAGDQGVAIGFSSVASGAQAIAIGDDPTASATSAIAIGDTATASAAAGIAIGQSTSVTHANSVALGRGATSTAANQLVLGSASYALADIFLGRGVTSATSGTSLITGTGGSGTNVTGHGLQIRGGISTGDAVPGAIQHIIGSRGSSGSAAQGVFVAHALEHHSSAVSQGSPNGVIGHLYRSEDITDAQHYAFHVRGNAADATPFQLLSIDLSTFASGTMLSSAGSGMIWCRVIASGVYLGTRYSAKYVNSARFEVNGTTLTLIDTGNAQHDITPREDDNSWDLEITASGTSLRVTCTGDSDHATGWHADVWISFTRDGA